LERKKSHDCLQHGGRQGQALTLADVDDDPVLADPVVTVAEDIPLGVHRLLPTIGIRRPRHDGIVARLPRLPSELPLSPGKGLVGSNDGCRKPCGAPIHRHLDRGDISLPGVGGTENSHRADRKCFPLDGLGDDRFQRGGLCPGLRIRRSAYNVVNGDLGHLPFTRLRIVP
jgi:hypothetical protein